MRTSELAGAVVTDDQVNKLQAYWGMPRRIRIDFNTTTVGNCDICGDKEPCASEPDDDQKLRR